MDDMFLKEVFHGPKEYLNVKNTYNWKILKQVLFDKLLKLQFF